MQKSAKSLLIKMITNPYVIMGTAFIVWLTFFDHYSLVNRHKTLQRLAHFQEEKLFYETEIEQLKADIKELSTDDAALEKLIRENYFYKKKGEEIFVITEQ